MAGLVYLGLFVFSVVFAAAAFIFGHDQDGGDHDMGGDHDADAGGMPSVFSTRVISLFLLGFSGMGLVTTYAWELRPVYSALSGLGFGVLLGALAYVFVAFFYREQASSAPVADDYIEMEGRVSATIPENGTGEVTLAVKEQLRAVFARSADGKAIADGRAVRIVRMSGGTAIVEPVQNRK